MSIATIGLGFILLIAGRPLYMSYTGAAAFVASVYLFENYVPTPLGWSPLAVSAILIAIGVGAGIAFRRFAAVLASAIFGYYLVFYLPPSLGAPAVFASLIIGLFAAGVCLIASVVVFDIALVALSALGGTTMILQYLHLGAIPPAVLLLILTVFGISTQFLILQYTKPYPN